MMPRKGILAALLLATFAAGGNEARSGRRAEGETVFLLHGLGRTPFSMSCLARHIRASGYTVVNFGYPSSSRSVSELADLLFEEVRRHPAQRVHFVTHSLGGIVVRACLKQHGISNLGRVVMLSPPNQGSEVADRLRQSRVYRWATGPAGQELGTEPDSAPNALGPVDFPLGVIAGSSSFNPLFSGWIIGPDDGKVAVSRARVEGMRGFMVVPRTHAFIIWDSAVARRVIRFLAHETFEPAEG